MKLRVVVYSPPFYTFLNQSIIRKGNLSNHAYYNMGGVLSITS